MSMTTQPARGGYGPAVLLALAAMVPAQINFTALGLLSPTIAQSLGVSPTDVSWLGLLGNGAYALGYLFAADLTQRLAARRLVVGVLGLLIASSLLSAAAPSLPVLIALHIVAGFAAGVLAIAVIPPLLTGFPPSRLPITITVIILGLFGASTLGPLVGGVVEQTDTWRLLFVINALLGLVALLLARAVVAPRPAPAPHPRVDWAALLLATGGIALLFLGIGQLPWHQWGAPQVYGPVALGVAALGALIAVEWVQPAPLLTVRYLTQRRTLGGAVLSWAGAMGYGGLFGLLPQFLEQIRGLGAQDAGLLLWPAAAAAMVGAVLAGALFATRWIGPLGLCGLLLLAAGAGLLTGLTAPTGDGRIMLLAFVLGLGASVSVAPGMFVATLSVPPALTGRTLALVTFLRYAVQTGVGLSATHLIATRTSIHYADLATEAGAPGSDLGLLLDTLTRRYVAQGLAATQAHAQAVQTIIQELLRQGRVLGINDVAALLLLALVLGAAVAGLLLLVPARRRAPARTAAPGGQARMAAGT